MKPFRMSKAMRKKLGDEKLVAELEALQNVIAILAPLSPSERARVLLVVCARMGDVLTEQQMQQLLRLSIEPRAESQQ